MSHDLPGKRHVVPKLVGNLRFGHRLPLQRRARQSVGILNQHSTTDESLLHGRRRIVQSSNLHQPHIVAPTRLGGQQAHRFGLKVGRDDCLEKQSWFAEQFGGRRVDGSIETEDRAERAQWITVERF